MRDFVFICVVSIFIVMFHSVGKEITQLKEKQALQFEITGKTMSGIKSNQVTMLVGDTKILEIMDKYGMLTPHNQEVLAGMEELLESIKSGSVYE